MDITIAMFLVGACMFLIGVGIALVISEHIHSNTKQDIYQMYLDEMYRRVIAETELDKKNKSRDTFRDNKVRIIGKVAE